MTEEIVPATANKGGAPLENTNALKHGIYLRVLRELESKTWKQTYREILMHKIALLRILILRTAQSVTDNPSMTLEQHLASLRSITLASGRLDRIYPTQKAVDQKQDTLEAALAELDYLKWDFSTGQTADKHERSL